MSDEKDTGEPKRRHRTAIGGFHWARRFAKLWGFLGFCILVLVLARHVVLPFVFALLLAYLLAPIVRRLATRKDGTYRMHRGLAIVLCYVFLLTTIGVFLAAFVPRVSEDVGRLGKEAPQLYKKLNDAWVPRVAKWIDERLPPKPKGPPKAPAVSGGVPIPPGTGFLVTPLPDGRLAVQVAEGGVELNPTSEGYVIHVDRGDEPEQGTEEQLRRFARDLLIGMQDQIGGFFAWGGQVLQALLQSVFRFFLVLMIAAFLLLDLGKIHGFARGLIPNAYRDDYDVIVAGIDRGLSGVIRGQLMICLVNGILTWVGLVIFGVKYALILGVVAGVLSLIPIFGSILSTVPIVLVALTSGDSGIDITRGVFMLAWILGIHFVEANLLNPKIIGDAAKIHPVLVIFALLVGEHSFGLTGALLAVPVASIVQVLFLFFRTKAWRSEPAASGSL